MDSFSPIIPRPKSYEFGPEVPRYWLDNCPIKTYFINALSYFIPDCEKFFILSVKTYYGQIKDPAIKIATKNFIQQEANHLREYKKYISNVIEYHYPTLKRNSIAYPIAGISAWLGGKKLRLAMAVVGEHFTAVLSDIALRNPEIMKGAPPQMADLWLWHCIEEIEHKSVAYDVQKDQPGAYFYRVLSYMVMTICMTTSFFGLFYQMMKYDKNHKSWRFYKDAFKYFFVKPGIFRQAFCPFYAYLNPWYHPWQHDNSALIQEWEQNLNKGKGFLKE
jgi:predicted metal-dependent hydrolase